MLLLSRPFYWDVSALQILLLPSASPTQKLVYILCIFFIFDKYSHLPIITRPIETRKAKDTILALKGRLEEANGQLTLVKAQAEARTELVLANVRNNNEIIIN